MAILTAIFEAPALILIISPTLRQSGEMFRKIKDFYRSLLDPAGKARKFKAAKSRTGLRLWTPFMDDTSSSVIGPAEEAVQETVLTMELANGSRIIALPGNENVRSYSAVKLLIIDEASRVKDAVYYGAVRPMLAVSRGRLVCLSTPCGKRGFFYEKWVGRTIDGRVLPEQWDRIKVTAAECPRFDPAFLEEERTALGDQWFEQEYAGGFVDLVDAVFRMKDIEAMSNDRITPLFGVA